MAPPTLEMFQNEGLRLIEFAYVYACFSGAIGYPPNRLITLATFWTNGDSTDFKPHKPTSTVLRRFMVLARKAS